MGPTGTRRRVERAHSCVFFKTLAAARALCANTELGAREIAEKALHIAADICVYTNHELVVEELGGEG